MTNNSLDEEAIFKIACKISDLEARAGYLQQICRDDQALFDRVSALLRARDEQPSFLESPPSALRPTIDSPEPPARLGEQIGPYKLREQIGEGGMGTVFVAEQEKPLRRKVALKVIKPGMDTKAVIARFEAERQALAVMDHPNIAKVLDAGTTDLGRPYFVMELVRGIEITEYCDAHTLTIRERLELFTQVCLAIQHAHQKGIIHRDIKPSNVLVTEQDGKAIPKVIDFGVAKAIGQRLTDRTIYTSYQSVIGTPLYMSPEQAALSNVDVDTRSDVYSLAALLYELLTGTTPIDKDTLKNAAQDEVLRIIREQDPPKPSNKISTFGERSTKISQVRRTDIANLGKTFRGDLDWIVMKGLEKDRGRRYDSASAFADDVQRYIHNLPIEARSPSLAYTLRKFAKRNKVALTSIIAFASMLLTMTAVSTVLAFWAFSERDKVQQALESRDQALKDWREELHQRAILAAFSGQRTKVISLIDEATLDGKVPRWEKKILGQLALYEGNSRDAIKILKEAVIDSPRDLGANSMLATAFLDAGEHSAYLDQRNKLSGLEKSHSFDELLWGQAVLHGDLEQGLEILDKTMRESPSPIGAAIRSHGRMKLYWHEWDSALHTMAMQDLYAAKTFMPENPFVKVLEFFAYFEPALREEISDSERLIMQAAFEQLKDLNDHPLAVHACAIYYDYLGESKKAHDCWSQLHRSHPGSWMDIYFAASLFRCGDDKGAAGILSVESPNMINKLFRGEALAVQGNKMEASAVYQRLAADLAQRALAPGRDDVWGIPESILLIIGEEALASEAAKKRISNSSDWERKLLEFVANPNMSPADLLNQARITSDRVSANKLIAFRLLGQGKMAEARTYLVNCQRSFPLGPEAYWASAISSHLEKKQLPKASLDARREVTQP